MSDSVQNSSRSTTLSELKIMQLCSAVVGMYVCSITMALSTQLYALSFRASLDKLAILTVWLGVWDLANDALIGWMQDKKMLRWLFSTEKWGRRAPWLLTHSPAMAVLTCLMVAPPKSVIMSESLIYYWFFVVFFTVKWCYTTVSTAWYSGVFEICAFKADRVRVEMWQTFAAWVGGMVASVVNSSIINADDGNDCKWLNGTSPNTSTNTTLNTTSISNDTRTNNKNITVGLILGGAIMISIISTPILKTAKKPANAAKVGTVLQFMIEKFKDKANALYFTICWFVEFCYIVQLGLFQLFLVYVSEERGTRLKAYLFVTPLVGLVTQCGGAMAMRFYFERPGYNPRMLAGCSRIAASVISIIVLSVNQSGLAVCITYGLDRLSSAPLGVWKISSRGWLIDDDVISVRGRRREGLYAGTVNIMITSQILIGSAVIGGAAAAGLDTTLCWEENQVKSGLLYLFVVFSYLAPCLNVVAGGLILLFPIHGKRLEELEARVELYEAEIAIKSDAQYNPSPNRASSVVVPSSPE